MHSTKLLVSILTKPFRYSFAKGARGLVRSASMKPNEWDRAMAHAEKIVGPTPIGLSLKFLRSAEFSGIAANLRRLLAANHPVLETVKRLVYHGKTNFKIRGLVILLLSKAAGHAATCLDLESACLSGITTRQYALAEIVESLYAVGRVHEEVLNLSPNSITDQDTMDDLQFGNKVSILTGDSLLARSIKELAKLGNLKSLDLILESVGDLLESRFLGESDKLGNPVPIHGMDRSTWEEKAYLSTASFIANGCKATLELAGHNEGNQAKVHELGKNIGLAWQLYNELQPFVDGCGNTTELPFDLTSLPVIFHLENNQHLVEQLRSQIGDDVTKLDYKELHESIIKNGSIEKSQLLLEDYAQRGENILSDFGPSQASKALSNIISSLRA